MAHGETSFTCPICFSVNSFSSGIGTLDCCKHAFCFPCISLWLSNCSKCPVCKRAAHKLCQHSFPSSFEFEASRVDGDVHGYLKASSKLQHEFDIDERELSQVDPDLDDIQNIPDPGHTEICEVCRIDKDDHLCLLCDSCNRAFHTYCVNLNAVPRGQWFCPDCDIYGHTRATEQQSTIPSTSAETQSVSRFYLRRRGPQNSPRRCRTQPWRSCKASSPEREEMQQSDPASSNGSDSESNSCDSSRRPLKERIETFSSSEGRPQCARTRSTATAPTELTPSRNVFERDSPPPHTPRTDTPDGTNSTLKQVPNSGHSTFQGSQRRPRLRLRCRTRSNITTQPLSTPQDSFKIRWDRVSDFDMSAVEPAAAVLASEHVNSVPSIPSNKCERTCTSDSQPLYATQGSSILARVGDTSRPHTINPPVLRSRACHNSQEVVSRQVHHRRGSELRNRNSHRQGQIRNCHQRSRRASRAQHCVEASTSHAVTQRHRSRTAHQR